MITFITGNLDVRINSITASSYKITPQLSYYGTKMRVEFNESCLKQDSGIVEKLETFRVFMR